jgi:hypothetical protein
VNVGRGGFKRQTCLMVSKTTVGNLTAQDMWQLREHRTRCAAFVASVIDMSGDPAFWNNGSIRRVTSIYMCWLGLGLYSWHFDILVSILS